MKKIFALAFSLALAASLFSQQHAGVPLDDSVYGILEVAQIRGLCKRLFAEKPYPLSAVLSALSEIAESPDSSDAEREIVRRAIERLSPESESGFLQNGFFRFEGGEDSRVLNRADLGTTVSSEFNANLCRGDIGGEIWFDFFLKGDLSKFFSYNFNVGISASKPGQGAVEPFSFTRRYDGYRYDAQGGFDFCDAHDVAGFGIRFLPELCLSFWNGKVELGFSRIRRDWGISDGNLMLSSSAPPVMALESKFRPFRWFSVSLLSGVTEYVRENDITADAFSFQNFLSVSNFEFFIGRRLYFALNAAVIYPKRFEPGYMHPGYLSFIYQNLIGDFDNMLLGATLAVNVADTASVYASFFMDEVNLQSGDFFHRERNIFSFLAGAKAGIPALPFSSVQIQYAKIEPYMYTHYMTDSPWFKEKVNVNYMTHGEGLGYPLPPNSDEVKVCFAASPLWFLDARADLRMARHGLTSGGGTYGAEWTYDDLGKKSFLADGIYEWIFSLGFGADCNMRRVGLPFTLGASFCLYYRWLSDGENGYATVDECFADGERHRTGWNALLGLSVKFW